MEFKLLNLERKKLIADYTAKVKVNGKEHEVAVRFINFMDGDAEYHVNGRTIPVDGATFHAINEEIIKQLKCQENEKGGQSNE